MFSSLKWIKVDVPEAGLQPGDEIKVPVEIHSDWLQHYYSNSNSNCFWKLECPGGKQFGPDVRFKIQVSNPNNLSLLLQPTS